MSESDPWPVVAVHGAIRYLGYFWGGSALALLFPYPLLLAAPATALIAPTIAVRGLTNLPSGVPHAVDTLALGVAALALGGIRSRWPYVHPLLTALVVAAALLGTARQVPAVLAAV